MDFVVIVPARYGSSRFPGKPLAAIAGRPMIQWVHEVAAASGAARVAVATDDARIADCVEGFGGEVVMTGADHTSGTERLAEAVEAMALADDAVVVNLQGDEPLLPPALLRQAAGALLEAPAAAIGTLATPLESVEEAFNPNIVKVVTDARGRALYFSRASIPWDRDHYPDARAPVAGSRRHLGVYAYRVEFLRAVPGLAPAPIEQCEALEQLRALWHGYTIQVVDATELPGPGVDRPEDIARVERMSSRFQDPGAE